METRAREELKNFLDETITKLGGYSSEIGVLEFIDKALKYFTDREYEEARNAFLDKVFKQQNQQFD